MISEGIYEQSSPTEEATLSTLFLPGYTIGTKPIIDIGLTETIFEQQIHGQYYPTLQSGPHTADKVALSYIPTDARFLYWMMGKQTASTGTRTISNMDGTARKPYLSLWKQTNNLKRHVYGVPIEQMSLTMEQGKHPIVRLMGKGMKVATDSFTPTISHTVSSPFDVLNAMTWDGDSYEPYGLTVNLKQSITPINDYSGVYQEFHDQTMISGSLNMVCGATNGETAIADWTAKTAKTFSFTLKKSSEPTHQIVGTFNNARIQDVVVNEVIGREPIYNIVALIESASFEVTDGI